MLIALIKEFEGYREVAYLDPAGVPTIGYGHTKTVKKSDVGVRRVTAVEAAQLLMEDLREPRRVATEVTGFSSGGIHNAIADFVFNLGEGALYGKTTQIAKHLGNKDYGMATKGMMRYVNAGGKKLPGLVRRRQAEVDLINACIEKGCTN